MTTRRLRWQFWIFHLNWDNKEQRIVESLENNKASEIYRSQFDFYNSSASCCLQYERYWRYFRGVYKFVAFIIRVSDQPKKPINEKKIIICLVVYEEIRKLVSE